MKTLQKHIILLLTILLWSCVSVRANEVVVAFVNGAPQGILWHDKDNWTMYVSPYMVVNSDRFTKHYYAGSQRIASKIGAGEFDNLYDASKACVTAGQKDYAERLNLITQSRNDYYAALGIPPGPPTAKGIYGAFYKKGKLIGVQKIVDCKECYIHDNIQRYIYCKTTTDSLLKSIIDNKFEL